MTGPTTTLLVPQQAFALLPSGLRADLLGAFKEIVGNFAEGRWEPSELNGGKLAEAAYTVCEGLVSGTMPQSAQKPRNMVDACKQLAGPPPPPRSIRIQVPRMLVALYEVRNNRNVGHVGGDVDPSHMDALCVLQMSKWVMAELIRVLHELPVDKAEELVDALVEREVPLVWKVGGEKRVLAPKMPGREKTLLLLHATPGPVAEDQVRGWVEAKNSTEYRRDILERLHKEKLVEYDPKARTVVISPTGVARVEEHLIKTKQ